MEAVERVEGAMEVKAAGEMAVLMVVVVMALARDLEGEAMVVPQRSRLA